MNIFFIVPPFTLERGLHVLLLDGEGEEGADGVLCGVSGTDSCALRGVSECGLCRLCRGLQRLLARDILHMFRFGWIKQLRIC